MAGTGSGPDRSYEVTSITELVRAGQGGTLEKYYRYTIKTRLGTIITVNIDERDATPEKAPAILKARAVDIDKTMTS